MRSLTLSESGWTKPVFGLSVDWGTESAKVEGAGWESPMKPTLTRIPV